MEIIIRENNDYFKYTDDTLYIDSNRYNIHEFVKKIDENVLYEYYIKLYKLVSSWKRIKNVEDNYFKWSITIDDITYSCDDYDINIYYKIRKLNDEMIVRCIEL